MGTVSTSYIDQVSITHAGNQLLRVNDSAEGMAYASIGTADFKNRSGGTTEYMYDKNGNLSGDYDRNIAWTKYNLLNLPQKVQMGNGDKTEYQYDALGMKRKATYSIALNSMQIPLGATGTATTVHLTIFSEEKSWSRSIPGYMISMYEPDFGSGPLLQSKGSSEDLARQKKERLQGLMKEQGIVEGDWEESSVKHCDITDVSKTISNVSGTINYASETFGWQKLAKYSFHLGVGVDAFSFGKNVVDKYNGKISWGKLGYETVATVAPYIIPEASIVILGGEYTWEVTKYMNWEIQTTVTNMQSPQFWWYLGY